MNPPQVYMWPVRFFNYSLSQCMASAFVQVSDKIETLRMESHLRGKIK